MSRTAVAILALVVGLVLGTILGLVASQNWYDYRLIGTGQGGGATIERMINQEGWEAVPNGPADISIRYLRRARFRIG